MKKYIILLLASALLCSCSTTPVREDGPGGPDGPAQKTPWRETFNGALVSAMSSAYSTWQKTNKIPVYINWEGVNTTQMECLRAGMSLLPDMTEHPDTWSEEDVVYPGASTTIFRQKAEPFLPREIPFDAFVATVKTQYAEMCAKNVTPMRFKVEGYDGEMTSAELLVTLCRAFAYYDANEAFPAAIDTWESSFCASTNNCKVDAPEVASARDAAFQTYGVTDASTPRQKAEAIFKYARDKWTWEDYYNTRRGAVGTIKAKAGNCCDLSHAIIAMARLSGIPARYFHAQCKYSSGYIGHVVSQLFVDGQWHMADASNDSNSFGKVTFTSYTGLEYIEELEW